MEEEMWAVFRSHLDKSREPVLATTQKNPYICSCGGMKIPENDDGLPTCTSCGLVESNYIDDSAEWINNVAENGAVTDNARCGQAKDLDLFSEQWGASTIIATHRHSTPAAKRLAKINFHMSMNHRDRALYHAYNSIERPAKDYLGVSDSVVREAKIMYRKFNSDKLTRGAVRTGIKANCVLYACKMNNMPRTTKEVANAFGIPTKDISRTTDIFRDTMLPKPGIQKTVNEGSAVTKPIDVLARILNDFALDNKRAVRVKCNTLANSLENCVPLMGKTPSSIAAVIVLKILGDAVTKHEIVSKCGISMPTLNKIEGIVNKYLEV
jgi:transcription initiation factor TFIIB